MYYNYQCFSENVKKSNCNPNKIWVDKGSEFYSRSMRSWLEKDVIEVYSTHNEGKSVIAERCIRILKNKIYICDFSFKKCLYW